MRTLKTLLATLATPIMLATAASAHPGHTAVVDGHAHAVDPLGAVVAVLAIVAIAVTVAVKFR
ncbi:DUF6732 family protein [Acuticoccus sp. I52.16.1]|uniref:DUF6732 family protein n=1 Tax=Acuticoccus sp. I52.16.1 TaxID=2928472 RepID=UPI001FD193B6|nr:DUF6732 family protein [Acuticoccus sp. I52.16.1]UOM35884.1 hypothetical protein MRB58_06700 [Acuticoccus sp. I52.16.1]